MLLQCSVEKRTCRQTVECEIIQACQSKTVEIRGNSVRIYRLSILTHSGVYLQNGGAQFNDVTASHADDSGLGAYAIGFSGTLRRISGSGEQDGI